MLQSDLEWFCKKNMYEVRASVHPPLPKNLAGLHLSQSNFDHSPTNKGECFLLIYNAYQNIVILSTSSNLQCISRASTILVDSTSYTAALLFMQQYYWSKIITVWQLKGGRRPGKQRVG